jgi:integrase
MWDTKLENKRGYFTSRFGKTVKKKFGLDLDHTLYSFRHTFIIKLYRELVKQVTPFEAKSKLMLITGHSSMSALEKYLRDMDAEFPDDYSEMLRN